MCPDCQELMLVIDIDGVEIDHCVHCHGTWLDDQELEFLFELDGIPPGKISEALRKCRGRRGGNLRCPRCRKKLERIIVGEAPDRVALDRCPRGHGLWFNRGEIEAVLRMSGDEEGKRVSELLAAIYGTSK